MLPALRSTVPALRSSLRSLRPQARAMSGDHSDVGLKPAVWAYGALVWAGLGSGYYYMTNTMGFWNVYRLKHSTASSH
eukprot:764783-Hanusia_phi.AAC.5